MGIAGTTMRHISMHRSLPLRLSKIVSCDRPRYGTKVHSIYVEFGAIVSLGDRPLSPVDCIAIDYPLHLKAGAHSKLGLVHLPAIGIFQEDLVESIFTETFQESVFPKISDCSLIDMSVIPKIAILYCSKDSQSINLLLDSFYIAVLVKPSDYFLHVK